jgi:predicted ArsR family transcriptional regulator
MEPSSAGSITERGSMESEARALGDPTRHRIFRYIADAKAPVGVAELTEFVRLNHNAVRQHLGALKHAGLVLEERDTQGRPGRPRSLYRLNPEVRGSWGTEGPYELLAELLSEVISTHGDPREVGRRAGMRRAERFVGNDTIRVIEEDLLSGGFRPEPSSTASGCDFVLRRCPFAKVASVNPETVCLLHLGIAEGLAEQIGEGAIVELLPKDARRAGCRLTVRVPKGI